MSFPSYQSLQEAFVKSLDSSGELPKKVKYSFPVTRKGADGLYDSFFLYTQPEQRSAPPTRPFAWAAFAVDGRPNKAFNWCSLQDFVPTPLFPLGKNVSGATPVALTSLQEKEAREQITNAYEKIRLFAFHHDTTVAQLQLIATYKKAFAELVPEGLLPFYYALSPDFFDWMRMPLPQTGIEPVAVSREREILEEVRNISGLLQRELRGHNEKDTLVEELHQELQKHRNGLLRQLTEPLERDVIMIIDDLQKNLTIFETKEPTLENYNRLYTLYKGVEEDLTDLLYRQGVDPYTNEGSQVKVPRQKVISTVVTQREALDKTVAQRLSPGWEKKGRIVRPEYIKAYLYQPEEPKKPKKKKEQTPPSPPATSNSQEQNPHKGEKDIE